MNIEDINKIASDLSRQLISLKKELAEIKPTSAKYLTDVFNTLQDYSSNDLLVHIINTYIEELISDIQTNEEILSNYIKANILLSKFTSKNGYKKLEYIIDYAELPLAEIKEKYNQPSINAVTQKIARIMYELDNNGVFELLDIRNNTDYCLNDKYNYRKIAERIRTLIKYEKKRLFPEDKIFFQAIKLLDKKLQNDIIKNLTKLIVKNKNKKYKTVTKSSRK